MTTRYIATFTYAEPRPYGVNGELVTTAYAVVWTPKEELAMTLPMAKEAVAVTIKKETRTHNIPALAPAEWKALTERVAKLNREARN